MNTAFDECVIDILDCFESGDASRKAIHRIFDDEYGKKIVDDAYDSAMSIYAERSLEDE